MKKNSWYLFIGCVALVLLAIFWYSVEAKDDLPEHRVQDILYTKIRGVEGR